MPKEKSVFVCQNCGSETPKWSGQCPTCGQWNTLVETVVFTKVKGQKSKVKSLTGDVIKLSEIKLTSTTNQRLSTGIGEFDRVLGGGIVPGSITLVAGEPGIGKSTLLTQLALNVGKVQKVGEARKEERNNTSRTLPTSHTSILYVCGEESPEQVKLRVDRLPSNRSTNLLLLPETNVDTICATLENEQGIKLVIIDSIQSLFTEDLTGTAGSVGQVRESAQRLLRIGKQLRLPIFLVGHVTKEGSIAGPKVLEHLVDTVLELTGERTTAFRILHAAKNRFGPTDEIGVFEMAASGLKEITNPSQAFLEESQTGVPGSAVVVIMEGTRPVLVEIQALVVKSQLAVPRRVARGIPVSKVQLLAAVLQRRGYLAGLGEADIFVNVAGGLTVSEPAADLGIALAIASSLTNRPLPVKTAVIGEVGLLGEIRRVSFLEKRLKEAQKLGYSRIISPDKAKTLRQALVWLQSPKKT
ncbi:DNA repair protein RadA [Microgenomates group bacterium RIFCSPLOWO2_01_FULL_46_13]|nr:MAG: DNA repair protein RadA [Microgenomates group bacterium RIFCSPHIGHO2_01_FULL_45_11]OGV94284.1 MAG: DNA repair protein RadA [Microgenomates group bacterium RIFCSPLOWO2_01_FULL_46_13]